MENPRRAQINHLGTATLVLDIGGLRLVTDPVLDGAGTTHQVGPAVSYHHHSGEPVPPAAVSNVDVVLLSHENHRDNLDAGGLALARAARQVITHSAAAARLQRRGIQAIALEPGAHHQVPLPDGGVLRITAVPARHGPPLTGWFTGPVIGFLLEAPSLPGPIYLTGDTRWHRALARWWKARGQPIHTIVAHAGAAELSGLRFSMDAEEVAALAAALVPKQLIPVHYEEWSHFQEGKDALQKGLTARAVANVRWLPLRTSQAI